MNCVLSIYRLLFEIIRSKEDVLRSMFFMLPVIILFPICRRVLIQQSNFISKDIINLETVEALAYIGVTDPFFKRDSLKILIFTQSA